MLDINTLSAMDVFPSNWKYPDKGAGFKDKCFNILLSRLGMDILVPEKSKDESFERFMLDRDKMFKTFYYANAHLWNADIDSLNQFLRHTDSTAIYVWYRLLWEEVIDTSCNLTWEIGSEDYERSLDFIMEEMPDYDYEFGDVYLDRETLDDAAKAFSLVHEGKYDEALKNDTVYEIASGFSTLFEDVVTPEQVLEHSSIFFDVIFMSENYSSKIHTYKSEEIYFYQKYRENVPENIRKTMDEFIDIVSCPLSVDCNSLVAFSTESDDERKTFVVILEIQEDSCEQEPLMGEIDFNGLWKTAFLTLDEKLPALRKMYGQMAA